MGTKIETYDLAKEPRGAIDSITSLEKVKDKKLGVIIEDVERKGASNATKIIAVEKLISGLSDDETREEIYTYDTEYPDNIIKEQVKLPDGSISRTVDYSYSNAAEGVIGGSVKKYKNENGEDVVVTKTYSYNEAGSIIKVATVKTVTPVAQTTP